MASISIQPTGPVSAYRPIYYAVNTDTSTADFEKIVATVYNADSGAIIGVFRKDWIRRGGSGPSYFYTFELDTSDLIQSVISPTVSAVTGVFLPFTTRVAYATASTVRVYVKFRFLYRTSGNLLADYGQELISNTITVLPTIRQHKEAQELTAYVTNPDRPLLHDIPASGVEVALGEAYALSFVCSSDINLCRVVATLSDGTTETAYILADPGSLSTHTDKRLVTVGVGPRNINSYITTDFDGDELAITSDALYYTVDFGKKTTGVYGAATQSARFNVSDACDSGIRLHWLNQRGGADAFTFDARKVKQISTRAGGGKITLPYTHDRQARGMFATDIESGYSWEVESRILSTSVAEFAAMVAESPEVYMETRLDDFYSPVIITPGTFAIDDTMDVGAILRFTVTEANTRIVQKI